MTLKHICSWGVKAVTDPICLGLCLLRDAVLVNEWTLNLSTVVVLNESFRVSLAPTLFKSSFAFLKVRSVVLRTNDGDEDDKGGYDTNKDTLNLMI